MICPLYCLRKGHTVSCNCRNGKVTPVQTPVFHKFLTPVSREKRRILPASTLALRFRRNLCFILSSLFLIVLHGHGSKIFAILTQSNNFIVFVYCKPEVLGVTFLTLAPAPVPKKSDSSSCSRADCKFTKFLKYFDFS